MTRAHACLLTLALLVSACATRTGHLGSWREGEPERGFGPAMEVLRNAKLEVVFKDVPLRRVTGFWAEELDIKTMYSDALDLDAPVSWTAGGEAQAALNEFLRSEGLTYKRVDAGTILLLPDTSEQRSQFADFPPTPGPLHGHPGYRRRHDFDFMDAPLAEVVRSIAAREHLRCEFSPEVRNMGPTTLLLEGATVGEALHVLAMIEGLSYELDERRMIRVNTKPAPWTSD